MVDPDEVDVVDPDEVDVVLAILVDVVEPDVTDVEVAWLEVVAVGLLVDVVLPDVVGVDEGEVSDVTDVAVSDVTEVAVSPDVLVDPPALVTDVDVSSPLLAHATPTTRMAAATAVSIAMILRLIVGLLSWDPLCGNTGHEVFSGVSRRLQPQ